MSHRHRRPGALVATALVAAVACTAPPAPPPASDAQASWPSGPLVDLSHAYGADTIFWPTAEGFTSPRWRTV